MGWFWEALLSSCLSVEMEEVFFIRMKMLYNFMGVNDEQPHQYEPEVTVGCLKSKWKLFRFGPSRPTSRGARSAHEKYWKHTCVFLFNTKWCNDFLSPDVSLKTTFRKNAADVTVRQQGELSHQTVSSRNHTKISQLNQTQGQCDPAGLCTEPCLFRPQEN